MKPYSGGDDIKWWEWPIITLFFIIGNAAYLVFELCRLPGRLWRGMK